MRNAGLDEAQARIKITGRNINNLRYADDTTLMAESEEELKSLLMKVKEESEKSWLKTEHSKNKDYGIWSNHFMGNRWGNSGNVSDFILGGSKITEDGDCSHEFKRHLFLGRKAMTNLVQFSSVTQSCLTLCDPMNHSMPGLPVHYQLPESTQTHVHCVGDAIQPSHPLSSPSPPALNLSQHQGLFK